MAVELELQEEGGDPPRREEGGSSRTHLYYLGLVVVVIGFASCVMQLQFHGMKLNIIMCVQSHVGVASIPQTDENCSVDISDGSWIDGQWRSHHCLMHYYKAE